MRSREGSDFRCYLGFLASTCRLALGLALALLPLLAVYTAELRQVGELVFSARLAALSRGEPILWLSGYYDSSRLKTEIAQHLRPKVMVFGSSRVMQIRREMLPGLPPEDFYNLGGDFRGITDARLNLESLVAADAAPQTILLGLDFWWFQESERRRTIRKGFDAVMPVRARRWLLALRRQTVRPCEFWLDQVQLLQRAWRDPRFWRARKHPEAREPETGRRLWGLGARVTGGFRNDGSHRYSAVLRDPVATVAEKREEGLRRFSDGLYQGNAVSPVALLELQGLLELARGQDIDVVAFMPPLESGVLRVFREAPQSSLFWARLPTFMAQLCRAEGVPFRDLSDPEPLGLTTRDFIDWAHGGERAAARVLLSLADHPETSPALRGLVDAAQLQRLASEAPGPYTLYPD
jgi:hypothetical protein